MTSAKKSEFSISIMLVVGLLAAVSLIYLFIFSMAENGYGKNMERVNQQDEATLIARIRPVVTIEDITGGGSADFVEAVVAVKSPKELYNGACMACHGTGVAGAPKLGDTEAWSVRAEAGVDTLLASAIAGKGAMPPKGGSAYSDDEIRSVIEMMLVEAGLLEAAPAAATDDIKAMPEVAVAPVQAMSVGDTSSHDLAAGEAAYKTACFACHDSGVAGAPKLGDAAAWGARIETGYEALLNAVLNGKGAMPPKGGAAHLSETDIGNIVAYMVDKAK